MPRHFDENCLIIASHNPGKVKEIDDLLKPYGVNVQSAIDLTLDEPEENGTTFAANAIIKSKAAAQAAHLPALADDSGLSVDALSGAPGIYSARWGGPEKDFDLAMRKVEEKLPQGVDRRARFVCALALSWPDGHTETFEGFVEGSLIWPPLGDLGFGYDPMFLPNGRTETFGQMDQAEKHKISHRAEAFRKLVAACFA
ncbi:MAG: non-canonical purine NTP pyrophosphatase, RdgB/HAM1 family [Rickettsiales bacterium]|jgi:XTP/dITP diphosphohydrolase|nr:non-canonical purine NTP pyrophosphatase, RdgB/HAM1 family [Rickettsiales bacterium]|tara:strand:+ start:439 stop:1035 length:597 start_codon:yes stop_codon:yes gene_type:complete